MGSDRELFDCKNGGVGEQLHTWGRQPKGVGVHVRICVVFLESDMHAQHVTPWRSTPDTVSLALVAGTTRHGEYTHCMNYTDSLPKGGHSAGDTYKSRAHVW